MAEEGTLKRAIKTAIYGPLPAEAAVQRPSLSP